MAIGKNPAVRCTRGWFSTDSGSETPASLSAYDPSAATISATHSPVIVRPASYDRR